jgi:hypothetical protein
MLPDQTTVALNREAIIIVHVANTADDSPIIVSLFPIFVGCSYDRNVLFENLALEDIAWDRQSWFIGASRR